MFWGVIRFKYILSRKGELNLNLIEVDNVSLIYHSIKGETEAIKNLSFVIEKGEFLSIIGPSGCGKSTLLNIISGILIQSSGEVIYYDNNIKSRIDKMGYMFQKDFLFDWFTVWDNVLLGLKIKNIITDENISRVENLLINYD